MFSFFKRTPTIKPSFEFIGADMHNHLLPGIDDGSPHVEVSLQLMEGLMQLGYKQFVCTPHIIMDIHPNNKETISEAYTVFKSGIQANNLEVPVAYAAEYMLNFDFDQLLAENKILSFGDNYVLIEMSFAVESPNLREAIFLLQTKGYKPILAHPERYCYLMDNPGYFEQLVDAGCDLQINILSLSGYYGKPSKRIAEKLIEKDLVTWAGTDLHHNRHLEVFVQMANDKRVLNTLDKIKNLKNPSLLSPR